MFHQYFLRHGVSMVTLECTLADTTHDRHGLSASTVITSAVLFMAGDRPVLLLLADHRDRYLSQGDYVSAFVCLYAGLSVSRSTKLLQNLLINIRKCLEGAKVVFVQGTTYLNMTKISFHLLWISNIFITLQNKSDACSLSNFNFLPPIVFEI